MKNVLIILLLVSIFFGGCSSGRIETSIDLTAVGPRTQQELSAVNDANITLGAIPEYKSSSPVIEDRLRVSAVTTTTTQNEIDQDTDVVIFSSQLQNTEVTLSENDTVVTVINSALESEATQIEAEAKSVLSSAQEGYSEYLSIGENAPEDFYGYSYYSNQTVAHMDDTSISVVTGSSSYAGAAHPSSTQRAANFELESGGQLSFGDVIQSSKRELVYEMILDWLEKRADDYGLFPIDECLPIVEEKFGPDNMDSQYTDWYLTNNGLTVFFNPYEISAYSSGIIQIEFSREESESILKQQYLPTTVEDQPIGSFLVYYNTEPPADTAQQEIVRLSGGGDTLVIVGYEPVYDVSLTNISWIGTQAIDQRTLYSANYLSSDNMLIIELDGVQDLSSLLMRLNPGDGVERTVYFDLSRGAGQYAYTFDEGDS